MRSSKPSTQAQTMLETSCKGFSFKFLSTRSFLPSSLGDGCSPKAGTDWQARLTCVLVTLSASQRVTATLPGTPAHGGMHRGNQDGCSCSRPARAPSGAGVVG